MENCPFCGQVEKLFENVLAQAFYDKCPVAKGHILITPKRHIASYFDLTKAEHDEIEELLRRSKHYLDKNFHPTGYNVGINIGKAAGQTVFHCHIHLIPRYCGDVKNPTGGVRGVIPEKQNYK
ncbi:HIT family protein [Lactococcus taiwanensis]|uniref:HIT family protein n=1 Tax=Lactococcus taiwanensis TaxID=1151742 RepID=UPI0007B1FBAB|nr:Diadenosine tetraphosphate (Ap4A) hydrolase [Lactococcus cremoris]